jgi:hypothetical protein
MRVSSTAWDVTRLLGFCENHEIGERGSNQADDHT